MPAEAAAGQSTACSGPYRVGAPFGTISTSLGIDQASKSKATPFSIAPQFSLEDRCKEEYQAFEPEYIRRKLFKRMEQ